MQCVEIRSQLLPAESSSKLQNSNRLPGACHSRGEVVQLGDLRNRDRSYVRWCRTAGRWEHGSELRKCSLNPAVRVLEEPSAHEEVDVPLGSLRIVCRDGLQNQRVFGLKPLEFQIVRRLLTFLFQGVFVVQVR